VRGGVLRGYIIMKRRTDEKDVVYGACLRKEGE